MKFLTKDRGNGSERPCNVVNGDHQSREKGGPLISGMMVLILYLYSKIHVVGEVR